MRSRPVEVVTAMVSVAGFVNAKPIWQKIKTPMLALDSTNSDISTDEKEQALRDHIASVRIVHLNSPMPCSNARARAGQILNFAAMHDGIVCHE